MANSSGLIVWDGGPSSTMAYATALYFTLSCMTTDSLGRRTFEHHGLRDCPVLHPVMYDQRRLRQRLGVH